VDESDLDLSFYQSWYADLTGLSEHELRQHWLRDGCKEGRYGNFASLLAAKSLNEADLPEDFDPVSYLDLHWDLAAIKEWGVIHAKVHFLEAGMAEQRAYLLADKLQEKNLKLSDLPDDFDWQQYLAINTSLTRQNITTKSLATLHYLEFGAAQGLQYRFDAEFYRSYYAADFKPADKRSAYAHYLAVGRAKGYAPTFSWLLRTQGFLVKLLPSEPFDYDGFKALNPGHGTTNPWQALLSLLKQQPPGARALSTDSAINFKFYLNLGLHYETAGDDTKAAALYEAALVWGENGKVDEHQGNIALRAGRFREAKAWYLRAIDRPGHGVYAFVNCIKAMLALHEQDLAPDMALRAVKAFPLEGSMLEAQLAEAIQAYVQAVNEVIRCPPARADRPRLIDIIGLSAQKQYQVQEALLLTGGPQPVTCRINRGSVLIVGDYHIPQCIRYRIEQKLEQLKEVGYTAHAVAWTDTQAAFKALAWHDTVIFYRVPALPDVVRLIASARTLGKLVFYEIDDLVFDPIYPPPLDTYGGYVSLPEYRDLLHGMALMRAAAQLCDYGIASTLPLAEVLKPLVRTGQCYLHRNGLDSQNVIAATAPDPGAKGYINLFYGSGTKAHNSDFCKEALPAIDRLLAEHPTVKLTIVGYLELPAAFLKTHAKQVVQVPLIKDVRAYWNYLAASDINLAVLTPDAMTDCKSELKWFEAACFGVPSVLSATRNYLDVIEPGVDALLASTPEDWYSALKTLIEQPEQRRTIGHAAQARVLRDYSVPTLAKSLRAVLEQAANHHDQRSGVAA
jgi:glycosyltransferase involved in cell wall biosynthesis